MKKATYLEDGLQVLREDTARQSLVDLIVPGDGLLQLLELEHVHNGRKGLLLDDGRVMRQAGDDGRLDKVARSVDTLPTADDLPAELDCLGNGALVVAHRLFGVQRPVQGVPLQRTAHPQLGKGLGQSLDDGVDEALMDDQPSGGGAALASSAGAGKERRSDDHVKVGVLADDDGIVPAQLQNGASEAALYGDAELPADRGAPGE